MAGFLKRVQHRFPRREYLTIRKAYLFSRKAHEGQKRADGKRVFSHIIAVASMLEKLKADYETITAGLLHDTIEDTKTTLDDISNNFNSRITFLVDAATKIDKYEDHSLNLAKTREKIITMGEKDKRVFIIKIIDRFHNLQTCKIFSKDRRIRFVQDTLEFYVPLADRMEMHEVKREMERLCKKIL